MRFASKTLFDGKRGWSLRDAFATAVSFLLGQNFFRVAIFVIAGIGNCPRIYAGNARMVVGTTFGYVTI